MSDACRPRNGPTYPHDVPPERSKKIKQAKSNRETACDLLARTHQALATTRQLLNTQEQLRQQNKARRERQAELGKPPPATPPPPPADIQVLLIEDSLADVTLFRHVLKVTAFPCQLTVLTRRSEVEAFVQQADTAALPPPRLIIADCRLPSIEAEEIIATLRTVPALQRIPVILFSSLPAEEGERRRLQCGAAAYIQKPHTLEDFVTTVAMMVQRWSGGGDGLALSS